LSAVITNSPSVPAAPAISAITIACGSLNGVIQNSRPPTIAAPRHAMAHDCQPNVRSIWRATGRRRRRLLTKVSSVCAVNVTKTRKNTRKGPRSCMCGKSSSSSAGACDRPNTHTITPHWIFALRSRKRSGSPPSALSTGIARNT